MAKGTFRFLGTAASIPPVGGESTSYLLDDGILIDLGWNVTERLRALSVDPCAIHTLILTHGHHDHYLGLPQFLFYRNMGRNGDRAPLRVVGPAEDVAQLLDWAFAFLQYGSHGRSFDQPEPIEIVPLHPGEQFTLGPYVVDTMAGIHPVPALCYRFEHTRSQAAIVVCSDTAYHPPIAQFARGARFLVHEASFAAKAAPDPNPYGHSSAMDAAKIAAEAGVETLYLVHLAPENRVAALEAAQAVFSNARLGDDGRELVWV